MCLGDGHVVRTCQTKQWECDLSPHALHCSEGQVLDVTDVTSFPRAAGHVFSGSPLLVLHLLPQHNAQVADMGEKPLDGLVNELTNGHCHSADKSSTPRRGGLGALWPCHHPPTLMWTHSHHVPGSVPSPATG